MAEKRKKTYNGKMDGSSTPRKYKNRIRREYLKQLRRSRGISAPQMAEMLGLSCRQHYLRYENGEREFGNLAVRQRYMCAFTWIFSMPFSYFERGEQDYLEAKKKMKVIEAKAKLKQLEAKEKMKGETSDSGKA